MIFCVSFFLYLCLCDNNVMIDVFLVMKIMAEVTVELCDEEDDITDDDLEAGQAVGELLEEAGDRDSR